MNKKTIVIIFSVVVVILITIIILMASGVFNQKKDLIEIKQYNTLGTSIIKLLDERDQTKTSTFKSIISDVTLLNSNEESNIKINKEVSIILNKTTTISIDLNNKEYAIYETNNESGIIKMPDGLLEWLYNEGIGE